MENPQALKILGIVVAILGVSMFILGITATLDFTTGKGDTALIYTGALLGFASIGILIFVFSRKR